MLTRLRHWPAGQLAYSHYYPHAHLGRGWVLLIVIALVYGTIHRLFYRHHRRRGLSVWVSMRGPFHTRISRRL